MALLHISYCYKVTLHSVSLEIGCPKTKVMVFKGSALSREPIWMCRGLLLEVVTMHKYLGIEFDQDHGIDGTYEHLASRLWAVWATLSKQYGNDWFINLSLPSMCPTCGDIRMRSLGVSSRLTETT